MINGPIPTTNNANIAYNYDKNPNNVRTNPSYYLSGLESSLQDVPNANRNVAFVFPGLMTTPTITKTSTISSSLVNTVEYSGSQIL